MAELKRNLEDELASSRTHAEKECERRMAMSRRVVARMLHIQLAQAFDSYCERVQEVKERKTTCKRVIGRMLKATSRWRAPALREMFGRWLGYVDGVKQEAMQEGNALAKREFADELAKQKSLAEARVEREQDRRMEQARRTVNRMLHVQIAAAFDSFLGCVMEKKRKREMCRRIVMRMQHRALAGAFDMFSRSVAQLVSHRRVVEKTMSRCVCVCVWCGVVCGV